MNKRRKLVISLGAGAFTLPFASEAQRAARVYRISHLSGSGDDRSLTVTFEYAPNSHNSAL